ncbi:ABC transporter substrate-binding protein [Erwinia persicina]|uniref:ABC transporter substrate-binding protein n=1 Tax=Erwinia persicina TaxID=55211 RepID=UPI000786F543|nr:ABC transporter substrate-binding protein [Erwinia persicina]MBC3947133.1 ABC transporter substrate-binding protein [Erwinia persicina]MBD8164536.1 ABC transporter substrate-binding protein [Erwinia persicina]MBD8167193.1 ABC transporter substrate-binding protein [Erwinia persicina]MCQ4095341.1 ABC transporter substrate-binding protein [Erwinia persicina]MCQ4098836.1 ABC transporter substrate-binding protein [Erwinia persicina]
MSPLKTLPALLLAAMPCLAFATTYPVTVTDMDGQKLVIQHPPQRVILQDGRDILNLALLDREDPFKRVVAWNNLLKKQDTGSWEMLKKRWPEADKILDMGFSDQGEVNLETVIARKPDLMIAQLRAKPALQQTGVLDQLSALKIPVLFVDDELHPVKNTAASVTLLGTVLDQEARAKAYTDYYTQKLNAVQAAVKDVSPKPRVFVEPIAGIGGGGACCFTHGHNGWGALIEATGAKNIGSDLLPGTSGTIAVEKVISLNPDYYVMSGSKRGGKASPVIPLGYNTDISEIKASFDHLRDRTGVKDIPAVKAGRVAAVYHHFYNHPYNIIGIEMLAKDFYPQQFSQTNPTADYHHIIRTFTQLPDEPINIEYHPQ